MRAIFRTVRYVLRHPLNQGRSAAALKRYLAWQIGSRLVPGRVVHDWVSGASFVVSPGDTGLTGNIYCGFHEFEEMAFVYHATESSDVFVDAGANAGSYTLIACKMRGAAGYCFEPSPSSYQRLLLNLRVNGLEGRVRSFNCALGDTSGTVRFSRGLDTVNHVLTEKEGYGPEERVVCLPLDEAIPPEVKPTVLKVDVEGFERPVLQGARRILGQRELQTVVIELVGNGLRYGVDENDVRQCLRAYGFVACDYRPTERALRRRPQDRQEPGTVIFVRDPDAVQARVRRAPPLEIHGRTY